MAGVHVVDPLVEATPAVDRLPVREVGEALALNGLVFTAPAICVRLIGGAVGTPAFYAGPLGTYDPPRTMDAKPGAPSVYCRSSSPIVIRPLAP